MNNQSNIMNNLILSLHYDPYKCTIHNFIFHINNIYHYIQNLVKNILNIPHINFINLINNLINILYNLNYYQQIYNYYLVHIYYLLIFYILKNMRYKYLMNHMLYKILLSIHNFSMNKFHQIINSSKNTLYRLNFF